MPSGPSMPQPEARVERTVRRLLGQVRAFEALLPHRSAIAPSVSRWSVGMHIHHAALVMHGVVDSAFSCREAAPRWSPNLLGRVVLLTGRMPRGRAPAPEATRPSDSPHEGLLLTALHAATLAVRRLPAAPANVWFRHFALGVLRGRSVSRFLEVHNRHHLRIISDILAV